MQQQAGAEVALMNKRRQLITINSIHRTFKDNRSRSYRTAERAYKASIETNINSISMQLDNSIARIINVGITSQAYDAANRKYKQSQTIRKMIHPSVQRNKYDRYEGRAKELHRKERAAMKIITWIKYPLTEDKTPMKRYIKIEKIPLPSPISQVKTSISKMTAVKNLSTIDNNLSKTIDQSESHQQIRIMKKQCRSTIKQSKFHKRNYSSNLNSRKLVSQICDESIPTQKVNKKQWIDDIQIRKPLGRKDYFVFGLTDRMSSQNKVQYFRDFLWKINYSNSLSVHTPQQIPNLYKAYVGPGNNFYLIKGILKRRFWWTIIQKPQSGQDWQSLNFLWTQLKQNHFFGFQQKSNNKIQLNLQINQDETLQQYKSDTQMLSDTPKNFQQDLHKKIFSKTDFLNWNKHTIKNEKTEQKIHEQTYVKRLKLLYNKNMKVIENSSRLKVHNHLQSNFFIGNKKALFYNMNRYLTLKQIDPFTIIPLTFHISKGVQDNQFKKFKTYYEQIQINKNTNGLRNLWIIKPGQNTNRGNGITVAYSLDDIYVRLKGKQKNNDGKLRTFIIQKYIQKPLLYCRRKFDIRHYMLITCINGCFKGYWYEEGYIRTSSNQFTTKYSKDPFVHLTNDAIQKNGANYGKYQKGNKLSYQDFQKYLENNYSKEKINLFTDILPKMKDIATQSVCATYAFLDQKRLQNNFQLLGLDFMIDQEFKPWLIQVNTNPCLELSCSLLQKIIPQLIENVFRICIDPLFPPPQCWQAGRKLYFGQSPLSQNKFEIIFDEYQDGAQIQKLYKGLTKLDEKMGKIEQDDEVFENDGDENWEGAK